MFTLSEPNPKAPCGEHGLLMCEKISLALKKKALRALNKRSSHQSILDARGWDGPSGGCLQFQVCAKNNLHKVNIMRAASQNKYELSSKDGGKVQLFLVQPRDRFLCALM